DAYGDVPPVSDEEYRVYGETNSDQPIRSEYFRTALAVSAWDDGIYLLNPEILTADGEWEAWFFANWIPGARRYRSFRELRGAEHRGFVQLVRQERGLPTPYADPRLGVADTDVDGLVAALRRPDPKIRALALSALANLRDRRAVPAVLKVYRNASE